jgi:hypothetical protein
MLLFLVIFISELLFRILFVSCIFVLFYVHLIGLMVIPRVVLVAVGSSYVPIYH